MNNTVKTALLLGALTGLLMFIGGFIGGRGGIYIAFTFAMILNFGSYWFSDKIVLKMYHAQEVSESSARDLFNIIRNLALKAQLPMPRVYIIPEETPNAFATGRNENHAVVVVTEGIMRILNKEELEGVIAHELSHIKNRDMLIGSIAATLAGASGAGITKNPYGLASALEKLSKASQIIPLDAQPSTAHLFIVNPLSGKSLMNLFSTHPPLADRIARLKSMKPY